MARKKKRRPVRRRRYRNARSSSTPDMENTVAAVLGGGGGALLGGMLVRWGVSPEMSALAMTVGGGVAAYTMGGNMRTAASGLAAAGAGQLALAMLAKQATDADKPPAPPAAKPSNAVLPPSVIYEAFQRARDEEEDSYVEDLAA